MVKRTRVPNARQRDMQMQDTTGDVDDRVRELEGQVEELRGQHGADRALSALVDLRVRDVMIKLLGQVGAETTLCAFCGEGFPSSSREAREHHALTCKASPAVQRIQELEVQVGRRLPTVVPINLRTPNYLYELLRVRAIDVEILMTALDGHSHVVSTTVNLSSKQEDAAEPWEFTVYAAPLTAAPEVRQDGCSVVRAYVYRGTGATLPLACEQAMIAWLEDIRFEV